MKHRARSWVVISVSLLGAMVAGTLLVALHDPRPMHQFPGGRIWVEGVTYGNRTVQRFSGPSWAREFRNLFTWTPPAPDYSLRDPRWIPDVLRIHLAVAYDPQLVRVPPREVELADENGTRIPPNAGVSFGVSGIALPPWWSRGRVRTTPAPPGTPEPPFPMKLSTVSFPRRGRTITVGLSGSNAGTKLTRFTIPNPADPGPFREWTPSALPVRVDGGGFSVELRSLHTGTRPTTHPAAQDDPLKEWVRLTLSIQENGRPSTNWEPSRISLSDATGNQYASLFVRNERAGPLVHSYTAQTLSASEPAWRIRIRLRRRNTPRRRPGSPDLTPTWTPPPIAIPPLATPWTLRQEGSAGGSRIILAGERDTDPSGVAPAVRISLTGPASGTPELWVAAGPTGGLPLFRQQVSAQPGKAVWRIPVAAAGDLLPLQVKLAQEPEFEFVVRPQ